MQQRNNSYHKSAIFVILLTSGQGLLLMFVYSLFLSNQFKIFTVSAMTSNAGTKNSSQTMANATNMYTRPAKCNIIAPCWRCFKLKCYFAYIFAHILKLFLGALKSKMPIQLIFSNNIDSKYSDTCWVNYKCSEHTHFAFSPNF